MSLPQRLNSIDSLQRAIYRKSLHQINRFTDPGVPIFEEEWDLLIVIDACRLDLFREAVSRTSREYVTNIESTRSVASLTQRWMELNFSSAYLHEMSNTAYVCGNPQSTSEVPKNSFAYLDEVWRDVWDEPGTVPPRPITDRAIQRGRETDDERILLHYMQPHCPFIPAPDLYSGKARDNFGSQKWTDVWNLLEQGELTIGDVWDGYRENLQIALDEIGVLLENIDAEKVIITSDHGNAIGEGFLYGHPTCMPFDCLRQVPWVETTAIDKETRTELQTEKQPPNESVEDRLNDLGYR